MAVAVMEAIFIDRIRPLSPCVLEPVRVCLFMEEAGIEWDYLPTESVEQTAGTLTK